MNEYEQAVVEAAEAWNTWMRGRTSSRLVDYIRDLQRAVDALHQHTAERDAADDTDGDE
jgi:hypothetical protein